MAHCWRQDTGPNTWGVTRRFQAGKEENKRKETEKKTHTILVKPFSTAQNIQLDISMNLRYESPSCFFPQVYVSTTGAQSHDGMPEVSHLNMLENTSIPRYPLVRGKCRVALYHHNQDVINHIHERDISNSYSLSLRLYTGFTILFT